MALTVGEIAALVNVVSLLVVTICDRAIEHIVRNYSTSRLTNKRRAPVVHDSDTWTLNLLRSLIKFYSYPGIFFSMLLSILLVSTELVTELGVNSSYKCGPRPVKDKAILTRGGLSRNVADAELAANALLMNRMPLIDSLIYVSARYPREVNNSTCFSEEKGCIDKTDEEEEMILRNCTISEAVSVPAGELSINLKTTDLAFLSITTEFFNRTSNKAYTGHGDYTNNAYHYATFLFHQLKPTNSSRSVTKYLEYSSDQELLTEFMNFSLEERQRGVSMVTRRVAWTYNIECDKHKFKDNDFLRILRAYRTMMLETTVNPTLFYEAEGMFQKITVDDVLRAVYSAKIIDRDITTRTGTYKEYYPCGSYDFAFMAPFFLVVTMVLFLWLHGKFLLRKLNKFRLPYSSASWFSVSQHSNNSIYQASETSNVSNFLKKYFSVRLEEFVLNDDNVIEVESQPPI